MKKIYKYPIQVADTFRLDLPKNSKVLSFQHQTFSGDLCLWAMVDLEAKTEERQFAIFGTGHEVYEADKMRYIATAQQREFVWHLFEIEG